MLEILALIPEEGWALVRDGNRTLLIRPPYTLAGRRTVDSDEVGRAITAQGFSVPSGQSRFAGWSSLVAHLNAQVEQSRAQQGQALEAEGLGERLLPHAPAPVLQRFLDRIERELLPHPACWDAANRLLLAMLPLPRLRESAELNARAVDLLSRVMAADAARKAALSGPSTGIGRRFPKASQQFGVDAIVRYGKAFALRPSPMGI